MDWDDVRFFLAAARAGSHSGAARTLRVAQPTVGRRIESLQRALGARLFERDAGRLVPTVVGSELLREAQHLEERMLAAERIARAKASGSELEGCVRVTASDWLMTRVLPAVLPMLVGAVPELRIEFDMQTRLVSLGRNEADLALRPGRFDANGVWQRSVGFAEFAVYASTAYLSRRGQPVPAQGCAGHDILLMDDESIADVRWLRRLAVRARVRARVNGRELMAQLALADAGLACLPVLVGDAQRRLVRVATLPGAPGRALWLGVHRDRRDLRRVRSVADAVARTVASMLPRRASA